jgi:hypothetical protein
MVRRRAPPPGRISWGLVTADGRTLELTVRSCKADLTAKIEESASRVTLTVAARNDTNDVRPPQAGPLHLSTQDPHLVAEHEQFDISVVHRTMSGAQRVADEVIDERQQHVTPSSRERMLISHLDAESRFLNPPPPSSRYLKQSATCALTSPHALGFREYPMASDTPPNDVRLALSNFRPVLPRGPTIVRPRHLENTGRALDTLDPKGSSKPAARQILHEVPNGPHEGFLFVGAQVRVVTSKAVGLVPRGQVGLVVEGSEELSVTLESGDPAGRDICLSLRFPRLPGGSPEPSLGAVYDLLRAEQDAFSDDLNLDRVALF